jgi:hypothetical protein
MLKVDFFFFFFFFFVVNPDVLGVVVGIAGTVEPVQATT